MLSPGEGTASPGEAALWCEHDEDISRFQRHELRVIEDSSSSRHGRRRHGHAMATAAAAIELGVPHRIDAPQPSHISLFITSLARV